MTTYKNKLRPAQMKFTIFNLVT